MAAFAFLSSESVQGIKPAGDGVPPSSNRNGPEAVAKPDGGFFCVQGEQLLLLVWLLKEGLLSPLALRAYLGLIELRGERFVRFLVVRKEMKEWTKTKCGPKPRPVQAHYAIIPELSIRTGLPGRKLSRAMKDLQGFGLVETSESRITFAASLDTTSGFDKEAFQGWAKSHESHGRRLVPIGRRMLNFLGSGAGDAKNHAALFSVVAGLSLRGAFYYARRENPYRFAGWARTDWLSEFVGASSRTVQRIKNTLKGAGWYLPQDVPQWAMNRYGERFQINPAWGLPEADSSETPLDHSPTTRPTENPEEQGGKLPQLSPPPGAKSAPTVTPYEKEFNKESPYGTKNQDNKTSRPTTSENPGPDDFQSGSGRIKNQDQAPKNPSTSSSSPRLSDIKPELDFSPEGTARLLELFRQAGKCGLIGLSDNDRLRWVAAAIRVMSQPSVKRPAAVFLAIIKGRRFTDSTDENYEEANRRIQKHLHGSHPSGAPKIVLRLATAASNEHSKIEAPKQRELSEDARFLLALRTQARLRNFEQAFPTLRTRGWDRPRFVSAVAEIDGKRPV